MKKVNYAKIIRLEENIKICYIRLMNKSREFHKDINVKYKVYNSLKIA